MGVCGLTKFIKANPHFLEDYFLHDCTIVIDGNNQLYELYSESGADFCYGGDYHKFTSYVKSYYGIFKKCNITPIVVFDGGYEKSGSKLNTLIDRANQRIANAKDIAEHGPSPWLLLPLLAFEAFETCLKEMDIIMVKSSFEADNEIASIANELGCPVVSKDSDFYIYNLTCGFVHIDDIDLHVYKKALGNNKACYYLRAKIYYLNTFLYFFPGLNVSLLPLFATLVGNDMINSQNLGSFFNSIPLPDNQSKKDRRCYQLVGLLEWLKNYDLDGATAYVLETLREECKSMICSEISTSVQNYNMRSTYLLHYIDSRHAWEPTSLITSFNNKELPIWFSDKVHQNFFPSFFINIACFHLVFLPTEVENFEEVSAFDCTFHLRRKIYGMFFQYEYPDCSNVVKANIKVEEYVRKGRTLHLNNVIPLFDSGGLPRLENIPSLSQSQRRAYFEKILDINNNFVDDIPEPCAMFACSLLCCIQHSSPKITTPFIGSLLLCLVYFSLCKKLIELPETNKPYPEVKEKISLKDLYSNIGKVEAKLARENLEIYAHLPSTQKQFDIIPIHQMSQFKSMFLLVLGLNRLLGCPYPDPHVANLVNGPFIYNSYQDLVSKSNDEAFLSSLLGTNTWLGSFCINFFHLVCNAEHSFLFGKGQNKIQNPNCKVNKIKYNSLGS